MNQSEKLEEIGFTSLYTATCTVVGQREKESNTFKLFYVYNSVLREVDYTFRFSLHLSSLLWSIQCVLLITVRGL